MIADLSPGPRRTYQLPGRTGWRTGAASGKGSLLFVSGQTAEAVDGSVPRPTSHIKQAQLAYQNMGALLEQAGGSFADVLDFTSFHLDIRGAERLSLRLACARVGQGGARRHRGDDAACRVQWTAVSGVLAAYSAIADMRAGARTGSTPDPKGGKTCYRSRLQLQNRVLLSSALPVMLLRSLTVQRFMRAMRSVSSATSWTPCVTLFTVTV